MESKIFDSEVSPENYGAFKKCEICEEGLKAKFTLACGAIYEVPLEYILMWFSKPHYLLINNELEIWGDNENEMVKKDNLRIIKWQLVLEKTAIRIFLNNDTVYDIPWDTLLMACEKRYEHFGGLTEESKKIVNKWWSEKQNRLG